MFEQAAIAVRNEKCYAELHALIDAAFAQRDVEFFLHRVRRSKLRIRDYEGILKRGLLGKEATGFYQALIRERYLRLVETVPPQLRERYAKAYTSY